MKMKKIFLGLIGIVTLGITTSCNDFLEEKPRSEMSTAQFFSAPAHARNAVNALYRHGAPESFGNSGVYMPNRVTHGGYLSGFFDNEYKGQEVICDYSQKLSITSKNITGALDGVWNNIYSAIGRANAAIKYIPTTPDLSEADARRYLGEAKFFRAFNYFYLVKDFGGVPLITEPYESLEGMEVPRASAADIYALIIQDLTDAVASLPAETFNNNGNRISRYTAETLLADVYLTMSGYPVQTNNYAAAANAARGVINSGKHSLIQHGSTPETSAYNVIRTEDSSPEYIYSYEFAVGISNSSRVQTSMPNIASTWAYFKYNITNNAYRPVKEYTNVYDKANDLRAQERQFFFTNYSYEKDGQTYNQAFPESASPAAWLWFDEDAMVNSGTSGKDNVIYRYAELLLIAAEAIAQSEGVTAEAVGYLADVRSRAYTNTPRATIEASLSGLSKDAFIQQVWIERMRELVFEYRTWSDIQRTRLYPVTSDANPGQVTFVPVVGATNPWGQTFQEKHLLWPISDNEMQRNPELVQNPGYEND